MICALAAAVVHGYLVVKYTIFWGRELGDLKGFDKFSTVKAIYGTIIFGFGFCIKFHSDDILLRLRKEQELGYRMPKGGFFHLVTSANYLGELVQWGGFGFAFLNPGNVAMILSVGLSLVPRAYHVNRWYRLKFPEEDWSRKKCIFPGWF